MFQPILSIGTQKMLNHFPFFSSFILISSFAAEKNIFCCIKRRCARDDLSGLIHCKTGKIEEKRSSRAAACEYSPSVRMLEKREELLNIFSIARLPSLPPSIQPFYCSRSRKKIISQFVMKLAMALSIEQSVSMSIYGPLYIS